MTGLFKDIEHGNPILAGGFHADFRIVVLLKPRSKVSQALGKGRETGFVVLGSAVIVRDTDAGKDKVLVNVETAAVVEDDLNMVSLLRVYLQGRQGLVVRKIESISKR